QAAFAKAAGVGVGSRARRHVAERPRPVREGTRRDPTGDRVGRPQASAGGSVLVEHRWFDVRVWPLRVLRGGGMDERVRPFGGRVIEILRVLERDLVVDRLRAVQTGVGHETPPRDPMVPASPYRSVTRSRRTVTVSCRRMARHMIDLETPVEKASLVAVDTGSEDGWTAQESLAELANLAITAGADVVGAEWQNRRHVDPNWYVGKGKAEELASAKRETGFDVLIADDELSPAQQRSLEELLRIKVIDRSRLILDIFALHAQTHEGRLPVEPAQLEYHLPGLTRLWTHLSRTQGGIGSRGPGESQLETDRRVIRIRIAKMKDRLHQARQDRGTAARRRDGRLWPPVGVVGYPNAGK